MDKTRTTILINRKMIFFLHSLLPSSQYDLIHQKFVFLFLHTYPYFTKIMKPTLHDVVILLTSQIVQSNGNIRKTHHINI